jgi:HEPN domain-containing protein
VDQELTNAVSRWQAKADHDLTAAERLLSGAEPLTDAACFHCQQAVGKYLKLFLIASNHVPPKTEEAEKALADARLVRVFVMQKLGL